MYSTGQRITAVRVGPNCMTNSFSKTRPSKKFPPVLTKYVISTPFWSLFFYFFSGTEDTKRAKKFKKLGKIHFEKTKKVKIVKVAKKGYQLCKKKASNKHARSKKLVVNKQKRLSTHPINALF